LSGGIDLRIRYERASLVKKLALAAAATSILFAGAASAADMSAPAPAYTKAPAAVAVPVYNWTGFYVGGNAGWVGGQASGTSDFVDNSAVVGSVFFSNPQSNRFSPSGFIGGLQAGFNWQLSSPFVLGIEGDFDGMRTSYGFCRQTDSRNAINNCTDLGVGVETISGRTNWLSTIRGRGGVTWANVLFYGTGGAAFGSIKTTESLSCLNDGCGDNSGLQLAQSATSTQTRTGWTAGLGIEAMIARDWSVKGEWLYVDLGSLTNSLVTVGNAAPVGSTQSAVWSRSERFNIVRVGVNYHFNSPVVAKY
jgi:outer membrane immunogenic protein